MDNINIKQKTVVEQLMKEIRSMIANGSYKHDDKIPTELELANKYGVSRTSVREAIKTLSYLGILESHTSQGTRVSKKNRIAEESTAWSVILGFEKVKEVFILGTALDTQVAIIIYEKLRNNRELYTGLIKDMKSLINKLHNAASDGNLKKFSIEFSQYFRTLYKSSDNTVFISLNECIDSLITNKVCKSYFQTDNLKNAADLLEKIWNSISCGLLQDSIEAIQKYGDFAFATFALSDE